MASSGSVVGLRRHLRRVSNLMKAAHRRHRATLAATLEDLDHEDLRAPPPSTRAAAPNKLRSFDELPRAKGLPILGILPEFVASGGVQHYHKYISKRHQELGGIFRERVAGTELVFVSDPVAVRQVFAAEGHHPRHFIPEAWLLYNQERQAKRGIFFMEGEEWKDNRSVLNRRLLRPDSVKPHHEGFSDAADALVKRWTQSYSGSVVPNIERELYRWAIESLGVMVFGNRLGFLSHDPTSPENVDRHEEMERFIAAIHGIFKETCDMGTIPPSLAKALRLPVWSRFMDSVDSALAAGQKLVLDGIEKSRSEADETRYGNKSLLQQLLHLEKMDQENIVRLLTDLFLAAADTTSHTAIWSLYLLGRNPQVAHRARQEVMKATGGSGNVQGDHLASLPYLKGVVKEALRLYPVAPFQTRALDRDAILGGHFVPAGTMVILSVYSTGRDPAHFSNPNTCSPERWLREVPEVSNATAASPTRSSGCPLSSHSSASNASSSGSRLHSHAFIPFGVGTRSCIGRRVAETQLHLLLAKLLAKTDLNAVNEVDMVMRMVGVTSEPLQLQIDPLGHS